MRVEQHSYLSAEGLRLRRRDGTPPWGVHPCEVDSVADMETRGAFWQSLQEARRLRAEIEAQGATP